jgi:hypothetical protein
MAAPIEAIVGRKRRGVENGVCAITSPPFGAWNVALSLRERIAV